MQSLRFIAWPDTHIPQHDPSAVDVAAQVVEWWSPELLVILGDFLDCTPVSHWLKNKRKTTEGLRLRDDFNAGNRLLDKITKSINHLVYLEGNHEDWIWDAIEANPEFEGLIDLSLGLKFEARRANHKVTHLRYGKCYKQGHLTFTHGIYTGKHHAARHVEAYGRNVIYGHLHDVQTHVKVCPIDVNEKHMGISMGCLCNKNPQFMENKPNNWCHCVGVGEFRADGGFNVYPVVICNGVASFGGKTFRSKV